MTLPTVLIPGLAATPRLYAAQIPVLWPSGPVVIADHTRGESVAELAAQILATAPPRFALLGLSMGGYLAFEILRQQPDRVAPLALLDTWARPDTAEQTQRRRSQIALADQGRFEEVIDQLIPLVLHPDHLAYQRHVDVVRQLTREGRARCVRPAAYRTDLPPGLPSRPGGHRLPHAGPRRSRRHPDPPELSTEIAENIPTPTQLACWEPCRRYTSRPTGGRTR
jgi:pimeloyl-ACP methyl ester carboxylesterase